MEENLFSPLGPDQVCDVSDQVNILLVDDKVDNLVVLKAVLNSPQYNLVSAVSGEEAIAQAAALEFAVILMDVQMPRKDGFETVREIRKLGASRQTPVIFVTAIYGDDMYINMGYDVGAVDYIFKPFNPHVLRSKVSVLADLFVKTKRLLKQNDIIRRSELADLRVKNMRREQDLRQKYVNLVNSINHCIIWSAGAEDLKFSFVSPRAESLTGFPPTQWIHCLDFFSQRMPPEDAVLFSNALTDVREGGEAELEHRFFTVAGETIWFHTGLRTVSQSDGAGLEICGLSVEITSTKKTQLELQASEEANRFLAEAGIELSKSLDYKTTLSKTAKLAVPRFAAWCAVQVIDGADIVRTVSVAHKDEAKINSAFDRGYLNDFAPEGRMAAIKSGRPVLVRENMHDLISKIKDTEKRELMVQLGIKSCLSVPMAARGHVVGTLTFVSTDKVYQKKEIALFDDLARRAAMAVDNAMLYGHAEKAIHAKDEFLSIASHELRTPLTPLKIQFQSLAKLIQEGKIEFLTPERLSKILVRADRQLDRLNGLIEDLLSISRINLNKLNLDLERTDLSRLINEVVEQFHDQMVKAGCPPQMDVAPSLIGEWDEFKIEQVIINLLANAIKYGQGHPIKIHGSVDGDVVRVYVEDKGIGIDPRDQGRIFDLFERAAPSQKYGGMGLGLFIARNIVKQHGGKIWVESSVGNGAKFIFEIPRINSAAKKSAFVPQSNRRPAVPDIRLN